MSKIVIHIGLHKTASTFLQENVWPQIEGYTYLTRPYTQHNHAFNQLQYADDSLYNKDLVIQELKKVDADRLLISDESFSGKPIFFSYINRSIIAKRLKEIFPNASIIIFLRDQKDILLSHYSSYIKMPFGTKKIEEFIYKPEQNFACRNYTGNSQLFDLSTLYYNTNDYYLHLDCFLYSHLVNLYLQLFEDCNVFLYEQFAFDNNLARKRLESIMDVHISPFPKVRKNISLSYAELEKQRIANQITSSIKGKKLRKYLQSGIKMIPVLGNRNLRNTISEFIGTYYSKDNQILKESLNSLSWQDFPNKYI